MVSPVGPHFLYLFLLLVSSSLAVFAVRLVFAVRGVLFVSPLPSFCGPTGLCGPWGPVRLSALHPWCLRSSSSLRSTGSCSYLPHPSFCSPARLRGPPGPVPRSSLPSSCGPARLCDPRGLVRLSSPALLWSGQSVVLAFTVPHIGAFLVLGVRSLAFCFRSRGLVFFSFCDSFGSPLVLVVLLYQFSLCEKPIRVQFYEPYQRFCPGSNRRASRQ